MEVRAATAVSFSLRSRYLQVVMIFVWNHEQLELSVDYFLQILALKINWKWSWDY